MGRRSGPPKRFKSKRVRAICKAVLAAGGTVTCTANGHYRVTGPVGIAIIGSNEASHHATANAVSSIRQYAGLDITVKA